MELQNKLVSAVLALEEPQRSTIILVSYEGLSPAEIARQQDIPATTVRSRLRAALVTLRCELEREDGGWKLALAPLVTVPRTPIALPLVALALLAVITTVAMLAPVVPPPPPPPPPPPTALISLATRVPELPGIDAAFELTLLQTLPPPWLPPQHAAARSARLPPGTPVRAPPPPSP